MSCQSRFDARYWMLGAGALGCIFLLLFRWGILHGVLLVVGWCWVLYSSGFLCVNSHYLILPRNEAQSGIKIVRRNINNLRYADAAAAKSLQSCPTLCNPIDGSLPGSSVPGILQAGTLEWVAMSFSNAWKWKVKVKSLSHIWLFTTPWTAAYQAPLSMGSSMQGYWIGLPLPSPDMQMTPPLRQKAKN